MTAKPGKRDELMGYMQAVVEEMQNVAGCSCYILGIRADDEHSIYIYEVWDNQAAHDASLTLDVFRNLIAQAKPIIEGMENLHTLTVVGGKM